MKSRRSVASDETLVEWIRDPRPLTLEEFCDEPTFVLPPASQIPLSALGAIPPPLAAIALAGMAIVAMKQIRRR